MDLDTFKKTIEDNGPPPNLPGALTALWWDAKGSWEKAHKEAQDTPGTEGAWVHAYLHRKEGDEWNAGYWYNRAGRKKNSDSLDQEWEQIVQTLLSSVE